MNIARYVAPLLIGLCACHAIGIAQSADDDEELYDLLMVLDILGPAAAEEETESNAVSETPSIDEQWVLSVLESIDEEFEFEHEQMVGQLRIALLTLRRAEELAKGDLHETVEQAGDQMNALLESVESMQPVSPDSFRYSVAEAQRTMALVFLQQADLPPSGTLADPYPTMRQRLNDLAMGAQYARQASQTARYRLPENAKRSLATAIAMSRLFRSDEVSLVQLRERIRNIESAMKDLGEALARHAGTPAPPRYSRD